MSKLPILLLSLILTPTWAAMPAEAQNLLDREGMQELAAKSEFDAKVAKIRKEALPKLQAMLDASTKKGDLDGAVAIKAKMGELDKPGEVMAKAGNKPPAHDDTQGKYIVLYNETDYEGLKVKVPVPTDISQVTALGFPNDALRSIQVPAGVTVHLYDSDKGGGAETIITESTGDLTELTHVGTTSLSAKRTK